MGIWSKHRRSLAGVAACAVAGAAFGPPLATAGEKAFREVLVRNTEEDPVHAKVAGTVTLADGTVTIAEGTVTIANETLTMTGDPADPIPVTPTGDVGVRPGVESLQQLQRSQRLSPGEDTAKLTFETRSKRMLVEQVHCRAGDGSVRTATLSTGGDDAQSMVLPADKGVVTSGPITFLAPGAVSLTVEAEDPAGLVVICLVAAHEVG